MEEFKGTRVENKTDLQRLKDLRISLKIQKTKGQLSLLEKRLLSIIEELISDYELEYKRQNSEKDIREFIRKVNRQLTKESRDKSKPKDFTTQMLQKLQGIKELDRLTSILSDDNEKEVEEEDRRLRRKIIRILYGYDKENLDKYAERLRNKRDEEIVKDIQKELKEDNENISEKKVKRIAQELLNIPNY